MKLLRSNPEDSVGSHRSLRSMKTMKKFEQRSTPRGNTSRFNTSGSFRTKSPKHQMMLVDNYMDSGSKLSTKNSKTGKTPKHLEKEPTLTDQEWEIQTLKKSGVLTWSDSDGKHESESHADEKELKHNRMKFLEMLNGSITTDKAVKNRPDPQSLNFDLVEDSQNHSHNKSQEHPYKDKKDYEKVPSVHHAKSSDDDEIHEDYRNQQPMKISYLIYILLLSSSLQDSARIKKRSQRSRE